MICVYSVLAVSHWLFPAGPCKSYIHSYKYNGQSMYMYTRVCNIYTYAFGVLWAPSRRIWPWLNAFVLYMGPAFKQRVARENRLPESQKGDGLLKE